jgi:hypothetical protein
LTPQRKSAKIDGKRLNVRTYGSQLLRRWRSRGLRFEARGMGVGRRELKRPHLNQQARCGSILQIGRSRSKAGPMQKYKTYLKNNYSKKRVGGMAQVIVDCLLSKPRP